MRNIKLLLSIAGELLLWGIMIGGILASIAGVDAAIFARLTDCDPYWLACKAPELMLAGGVCINLGAWGLVAIKLPELIRNLHNSL